ncbi:MAG: cyclic pyranopterin monophosphate synthase MoaC [Planctomycetes bacterium]|jgi:cyclic pyranopterin phosphate synthase|nr:cyclic pyranopterin monophosphate synthase MoaC [Planctomycetota bacterium]HJO26704.1 cyclic pyranopterin monophosphate synthase MoaC [Planctomycetota bacterium]
MSSPEAHPPARSDPGRVAEDDLDARLSHLRGTAEAGEAEACMVDVGAKAESQRGAVARALVRFPAGLLGSALAAGGPKGPIQEVARAAGILGAKRTAELIPMCHPLGLDHVEITFKEVARDLLEIRCRTTCRGRTGVEMESMVGASLAALTVYDMTKGLDKGIRVESVEVLEKHGGKSGTWTSPRAQSGA